MKLRYLLLSLLLSSHVSWAEGIAWQQLPAESQATLSKMKDRWQDLPPAKQEAMAERARAWEQMPSEQRTTSNLKNCHQKSKKR